MGVAVVGLVKAVDLVILGSKGQVYQTDGFLIGLAPQPVDEIQPFGRDYLRTLRLVELIRGGASQNKYDEQPPTW